MKLRFGSALALLFLIVATPAATIAEISSVDRLLRVLEQRLIISDQVAMAKWNSGAAIEDPPREEKVRQAFAQQAEAAGVDKAWADQVMAAQIEASKARQRQLFWEWKGRRQPAFASPPDLAGDIRPQLDRLSGELILSLKAAGPVLERQPSLLPWRAEVLWGARPSQAERLALSGL
jgi:chorismate mutase